MKVLIATEARFDRTPDGACWNTGTATYQFWRRYLEVFDEVGVVGRVQDVAAAPVGAVRADGPGVTLRPLPYYIGPWAYLRRHVALRRAARALVANGEAVILRAPGVIAGLLVSAIRPSGRPFGIEVVGDPHDSYGPGGVRTVLRPLLRHWWPRALRHQCAHACAVAYVTERTLQEHYPPRIAHHVTSFSSIDLPDEAFVAEPRVVGTTGTRQRLLFVGSLEQLYKAPDVLIDAVALAVAGGADLALTLIGDGMTRPVLEAQVARLGLSDRVRFLGHLPPGPAVRAELDAADVVVLPSRTEGLPRALIEAMARGLPCIGSHAGGIPELLSPSERVPAGDAHLLALKITELIQDGDRMTRLSRENLSKARRYHADVLRPRRIAFYEAVRKATELWRQNGGPLRRS